MISWVQKLAFSGISDKKVYVSHVKMQYRQSSELNTVILKGLKHFVRLQTSIALLALFRVSDDKCLPFQLGLAPTEITT